MVSRVLRAPEGRDTGSTRPGGYDQAVRSDSEEVVRERDVEDARRVHDQGVHDAGGEVVAEQQVEEVDDVAAYAVELEQLLVAGHGTIPALEIAHARLREAQERKP